jgi:GT2 family glycosyltransferase
LPSPRVEHRPRVAAIVVTHNRREVLESTLLGVLGQDRPPDTIVVVDNASTDGTRAQLAPAFESVDWITLTENFGYGAGLAEGMERCRDGHDWLWLLDDDSRPGSTLLATLLDVAGQLDRVGMVGTAGGALRWGVPDHEPRRRHVALAQPRTYASGFLLVDGGLVNAEVARTVGVPRRDFFMMMEDVEYTSRIATAGWHLYQLADAPIERLNLGSVGGKRHDPWRSYYQTRNHLRTALDRRSPTELAGWAYRTIKLIVGGLLYAPHRRRRLTLRLHGALDGFRGRGGRTVVARDVSGG